MTLNPSSDPELFQFLMEITAFDTVDDESVYEEANDWKLGHILPINYTSEKNPQYAYWMYYLYANIDSLS